MKKLISILFLVALAVAGCEKETEKLMSTDCFPAADYGIIMPDGSVVLDTMYYYKKAGTEGSYPMYVFFQKETFEKIKPGDMICKYMEDDPEAASRNPFKPQPQ